MAARGRVQSGFSWQRRLTVAAALALCPVILLAQDTPVIPRFVRIVIASVPATGPDFIARLIAPKLGEAWRVNVVVANRPGSHGIVGAQYVAQAAPDGAVGAG